MNNLLKTTMLAALTLTLGVAPALADEHAAHPTPVTADSKIDTPAAPVEGVVDEGNKKDETLKDGAVEEVAPSVETEKVEEKK